MPRSAVLASLLLPAALVAAPVGLHAQAAPAAAPESAPAVWRIDPAHSELSFRIRHLVSRVRGSFGDFAGTVVADPVRWENGSVDVTIQAASIDTQNERRDADLRSPNFFAVDSFPTITFRSTRIERNGDRARIHGVLTMRGVSRPVVLDGTFLGIAKDRRGDRLGFEATTTLNRLDYGITWNRAAEGGGVVLADDVEVTITIAAVRQPATQATR